MSGKRLGANAGIRYSEAFKLEIVRELEAKDMSFNQMRRKYGIGGTLTVHRWVLKYGNGTRGKMIKVMKPQEIDELAQLKKRVRQLERALADANIDLVIERAYTEIACERAGIADVEEFKKKNAGTPPIER